MFSRSDKIVECVTNFSEGKDSKVVQQISGAISNVPNVKVLHVDQGIDANRTVVTFAGFPDAIIESAFQGIKVASELIDMSKHIGVHSRVGAADVCPLIPIANVSMRETIEYSRKLAGRVSKELEIPVYLYEHSAISSERRNLANIRKGQYEGLAEKMKDPKWRPDFGPSKLNVKSGATVIGARDLLVAFNMNLNTDDVKIAKSIAQLIRESGFKRKSGIFKGLKAIGWYMKEYGEAQVSMNITNINTAPLHLVFDKVCELAADHNVGVNGSEPIGLIPKQLILNAGRYFRRKKAQSTNLSEKTLIDSAIEGLRLDYIKPFDPEKRILEKCLYSA